MRARRRLRSLARRYAPRRAPGSLPARRGTPGCRSAASAAGRSVPYHGWRFDGADRCVHIPRCPASPPASHWPRTLSKGARPSGCTCRTTRTACSSTAADAALRKLNTSALDVAAARRIVGNFLDWPGFGFVHEGWLGDRAHAQLADYRIRPTATGFVASGCRAWQPQGNRLSSEGSWVDYRYELTSPYTAVLTKLPEKQGRLPRRDRAVRLPGGRGDEPRLVPHGADRPRLQRRADPRLPAHHLHAGPAGAGVAAAQAPAAGRRRSAYRRPRRIAARPPTRRFLRDAGITFGVLPVGPRRASPPSTRSTAMRSARAAARAQRPTAPAHRGLARSRADLRAGAAQRRGAAVVRAWRPCARPMPSPTCRASSTSTTPAPACS